MAAEQDGSARIDGWFDARAVAPAIRLAMRILEFEQTLVPSIASLARRVGMSEAHFSRTFAAQVGETSAAYGRRIRLDHAVNRYLHDPAPMSVIADAFGFESQAAFTRAFTRQHGMSPRRLVAARFPANARPDPASEATLRPAVLQRAPQTVVARRFFGTDHDAHWHTFLTDLPAVLADGALLGMSYDNSLITPGPMQRYDCAVVVPDPDTIAAAIAAAPELDAIELAGGLHAELAVQGDWRDVALARMRLLRDWLPQHPEYQPEGDPLVVRFTGPGRPPRDAVVTIRLHPRNALPLPNARPLTQRGRDVVTRTATPGGAE